MLARGRVKGGCSTEQSYPNQQDYLAVYESFGLIDSRTKLGHSIDVSARENQVLQDTKVMISHCPSSNMFLGSGLCPAVDYLDRGLRLSLGTDVGAGTSYSLWKIMADAYKVASP